MTSDGNSLLLWRQKWRHVSTLQDSVLIPEPRQTTKNAKQTLYSDRVLKRQASWQRSAILQTFCHYSAIENRFQLHQVSGTYLRTSWRQPVDLCGEPETNLRIWMCRLTVLTCCILDPNQGAGLRRVTIVALQWARSWVLVTSSVISNIKYITLMTAHFKYVSILNGCYPIRIKISTGHGINGYMHQHMYIRFTLSYRP